MGIKIFVGNTGYSEAGGKKWGNKGIKNFGIFLVLRRKTGIFLVLRRKTGMSLYFFIMPAQDLSAVNRL